MNSACHLTICFRSEPHPLTQMHSVAVYQKALCRLIELETLPVLNMLEQRHKFNTDKVSYIIRLIILIIMIQIAELKEEKQRLEARLRSKKAKSQ
jgi:hypothetical protein